jgi:thioredoxin 1
MPITIKDFYADWCGPCKTQDPILEEVAEDFPDITLEKVNVDEDQDIANEYQVRSLPTLVVENDEGIVDRFVGVTQRDEIEKALQKAGAAASA